MKQALFVTARLPFPPDDGWKIRTYHIMKGVAASGYKVDLVTFMRPGEDHSLADGLKDVCRTVDITTRQKNYAVSDLVKGVLTQTPFPVYNYHDKKMISTLAKRVSSTQYDVVQFEDIVTAHYRELIPLGAAKVILDMHNIESHLMERFAVESASLAKSWYARQTARKLSRHELEQARNCDRVFVCSCEDGRLLEERGNAHNIVVIPNGVDTVFFSPMEVIPDLSLVFVGSMDYHANVTAVLHFARHIFPLIASRHPNVRWYIVGKNPTCEVRALASEQIIVTGAVPDVRPYVARAAVIVVPLLVGGGTRLKILEAMAMGKAVLSTSIGSEGIAVTQEENILLADTPEDFANEVSRLLEDHDLTERLGIAARAFVELRYSWDVITHQLAICYGSLLC
jgi:polysaccharide biosynthesis protein PslH